MTASSIIFQQPRDARERGDAQTNPVPLKIGNEISRLMDETELNTEHADMKTDPDGSAEGKQAGELTPADRIRELLSIDSGVSQIVESAGLAVQALTAASTLQEDGASPEESMRTEFEKRTSEYVLASQSVIARLRRQIYALEEAQIISRNRAAAEPQQSNAMPSQAVPTARGGIGGSQLQTKPPMHLTNGGLGKLEVGWLNSRIDRVGKQKESELWSQTRQHLEGMMGNSKPDAMIDDEMDLDG